MFDSRFPQLFAFILCIITLIAKASSADHRLARNHQQNKAVDCAARAIASNPQKWTALHSSNRQEFGQQLRALPCLRRELRRIDSSAGQTNNASLRQISNQQQRRPGNRQSGIWSFLRQGDDFDLTGNQGEEEPTTDDNGETTLAIPATTINGQQTPTTTKAPQQQCDINCPMSKVDEIYRNLVKCVTDDVICCTCIFFIGMGVLEAVVNESDAAASQTDGPEVPRVQNYK